MAAAGGEGGVWRVLGLPRHVALSPGVWAVFLAHMAFNFGAYYMTNWNPTYYSEVLGLTAAQARIHLARVRARARVRGSGVGGQG